MICFQFSKDDFYPYSSELLHCQYGNHTTIPLFCRVTSLFLYRHADEVHYVYIKYHYQYLIWPLLDKISYTA